jgi:hypothetical protein
MKLPNGDRAVVDEAKLRDYCLSATHSRGRHKARVFRSVMGITDQHVPLLRDALLGAAAHEEAQPGNVDEYGQRYSVDFDVTGPTGAARVRSTWIVLTAHELLRCFVYSSHPLRYSRVTYCAASGQSVAFRLAESHVNRFPARYATFPSSTVSASAPE